MNVQGVDVSNDEGGCSVGSTPQAQGKTGHQVVREAMQQNVKQSGASSVPLRIATTPNAVLEHISKSFGLARVQQDMAHLLNEGTDKLEIAR